MVEDIDARFPRHAREQNLQVLIVEEIERLGIETGAVPFEFPRQGGEATDNFSEDAAREHERVMEQAKGEISELMSAAAEKLVLSSTSDAYDKFLDTAEERKDNG